MAEFEKMPGRIQTVELDLLEGPLSFPKDVDVAYYLVHSMGSGRNFAKREEDVARNFAAAIERTDCRQVIFLGGLLPEGGRLSPHLRSRQRVEELLSRSAVPLTTLRASIIVGSGSASFEIIRDLVEKLPVMLTPRGHAICQPIAIRNVIGYLLGVALMPQTFGRVFEIGGPERLSYETLLRQYARMRGLQRTIISVPFLSLRLSSLWLFFVTNTSFPIARALVDSMTHETVCRDNALSKLVPQVMLTYSEAIEKAFARIAQNRVPSSWFDALASGRLSPQLWRSIHVPEHGVLRDQRKQPLRRGREAALDAIWILGGQSGWPSMNWAWRLRGALDRLSGGIGIRRGRRNPHLLQPGDALISRGLLADRVAGRLTHAETKPPGSPVGSLRARTGANRDFSTARTWSSLLVSLLSSRPAAANGAATVR